MFMCAHFYFIMSARFYNGVTVVHYFIIMIISYIIWDY